MSRLAVARVPSGIESRRVKPGYCTFSWDIILVTSRTQWGFFSCSERKTLPLPHPIWSLSRPLLMGFFLARKRKPFQSHHEFGHQQDPMGLFFFPRKENLSSPTVSLMTTRTQCGFLLSPERKTLPVPPTVWSPAGPNGFFS
jgi:hypothetical protein